jgi:hypothetical protein
MSELDTTRFESAIKTGLERDSTPFIQALGNELLDGGIEDGVRLTLKGDQFGEIQRLAELVHLPDEKSSIELIKMATGSDSSIHSFGTRRYWLLGEAGIGRTLQLLQAEGWKNIANNGSHIGTALTFGTISQGDEFPVVDTHQPVVEFSASGRLNTTIRRRLAKAYRDLVTYDQAPSGYWLDFAPGTLARKVQETEQPIDIPIAYSHFSIGHMEAGFGHIGARARRHYRLKNGSLASINR